MENSNLLLFFTVLVLDGNIKTVKNLINCPRNYSLHACRYRKSLKFSCMMPK